MKPRPPKELLKYISFKDGKVVTKSDMPENLQPTLDKFRKDFEKAKEWEKQRWEVLNDVFRHD